MVWREQYTDYLFQKYVESFTLKGGIFLYALFDGEYARTTMDIDLLAQRIPNDAEKMKKIFNDIFSIECDDALRYDLNTFEVIKITEFKEYHGVNVSIMGYLDRTRVPVSIDIGFGDVVYPERIKMGFPVLLDMEAPEVYAYSIYSVIAEKFDEQLAIDYSERSVYWDGNEIPLLKKEFDILEVLSQNPGQIFDKERLYEAAWGLDGAGNNSVVAEHIRKIRARFAAAGAKQYIETVWGVGYKWVKPDAN